MASIESYLKINNRNSTIKDLSVQQIVSCMPIHDSICTGEFKPQMDGCAGGWIQSGFTYAEFFGLASDCDYPYNKDNPWISCRDLLSKKAKKSVTVRGYEVLQQNNYQAIMNHLAYKGPLSVIVATDWDWEYYSGGIFDGCKYDEQIELNHGKSKIFRFS